MTNEQEYELHRCDGCHTDRLCREYKGLWLCLKGPAKCYRKRQAIRDSLSMRGGGA
jgi:ribosomal protein L37AE/L43A